MNELARTQDITLCLIGSEQHKAKPDLGDDSGFWLRVKAADASPSVAAMNAFIEPCREWIESVMGCARSDSVTLEVQPKELAKEIENECARLLRVAKKR